MAFDPSTFVPTSAMANSSASRVISYTSDTDAIAAIKASGYFSPASATSGGLGLTDGDVILASDNTGAASFLKITVDVDGLATTALALDFA
jgi:hypothetical protein